MLKVGLTGGIGSGKTTIIAIFKRLGAVCLNSDQIVHELMEPGTTIWKRLIKEFGKEIVFKNKKINRRKLAEIIFSHPKEKKKLESIIHPEVIKRIKSELKELEKKKKCEVVVVEVPLLFETHSETLFDKTISAIVPQKEQLKYCLKKGLKNQREVDLRRCSQMSQTEKARRADYVIRNNSTKKELERKVTVLWKKLKQLKNSF